MNIRKFAIARTILTALANLIDPIATTLDRAATRLAFWGRPADQE